MMNIAPLFVSLSLLLTAANAAAAPEMPPVSPEPSPTPTPPVETPPPKDTLEAAYKREFAFLQAQRRELEQRLESFHQQSQTTAKQLEQKLRALEKENASLTAEADRLHRTIEQTERRGEAARERNELLQMTFKQATATLETYDFELPPQAAAEDNSPEVRLLFLFRQGINLLQQVGQVHRRQEKFFLQDGAETKGTVIRFGNIAAYGVSPQGAGALIPTGGGRLKISTYPTEDTARSLTVAAGQQPTRLKLFLFESQEQAIEEKSEKTLLATLNAGGPIAWVIVGLGGIALLLILLRVLFLAQASANTRHLTEQVGTLIREGKQDQAQQLCQQNHSAIARVMAATVRNLKRDRAHLEDIISEAILHESAHLNRFGAVILVIAAISPLLGLLGTVTGMISTFDIITEFGTGDPKLLSTGIAIALITTEVGLMVAIPTLFAGTLLSGWAERIKDAMEKAALRITNLSQTAQGRPAPASAPDPADALTYSSA